MKKIEGRFDVTLAPLEPGLALSGQFGRMSIDKTFHGLLKGKSRGQMLSVRYKSGSAGYVAIEEVTGSIEGKSGSFALQHFGVMSSAGQRLVLEVVPGSATNELTGLSGTMTIEQANGEHSYGFEYTLHETD